MQCRRHPHQLGCRPLQMRMRATASLAVTHYCCCCCHPPCGLVQGHEPRISRAEGTYAVVVAPTRELCIQIQDVATVLLRRFIWIVSSVLIGGEHRGHEKARLRKGVSIVVASPGRLQDHLEHTSSFRTRACTAVAAGHVAYAAALSRAPCCG